jgi:predicted RNA-binding protein with PIN domain
MSKNIQLQNDPRIQAAAAAYMSVDITYTLEDEDADAFSEKATQAITNCYTAMGISETSPWADEVAEAIRELADKMQYVLVEKTLLTADCAEVLQAQKVA